jgi:DNA-binding NarL/FixJ family response regulator
MGKISIMLVEDHDVVREGLRALLLAQQDIEVIGEARDGREAVDLARRTEPQVVVMDVSMPVLNGLDASRQILRAAPETKILVLSSYDDCDCVKEMTDAGVKGFLSKRTAATHLVDAIRTVRAGKTFYSPEVAKRMREQQTMWDGPATLTQRELEVLQLIAQGLPNKGIAAQLGISIKTVEKHRQGAMNKLNIHEVAGLTRYALTKGLVPEQIPVHTSPPEEKPEPPQDNAAEENRASSSDKIVTA